MMGKRKPKADGAPREVHPLVQRLVGQILKRTPQTREGVSKEAKRHVQTLYGWLNGRRKSPSLLAFNDYATAAGLTLVLSDVTGNSAQPGSVHVTSDFEKSLLVAVRGLTEVAHREELLDIVRDYVLAHTTGSRPPAHPSRPALVKRAPGQP